MTPREDIKLGTLLDACKRHGLEVTEHGIRDAGDGARVSPWVLDTTGAAPSALRVHRRRSLSFALRALRPHVIATRRR